MHRGSGLFNQPPSTTNNTNTINSQFSQSQSSITVSGVMPVALIDHSQSSTAGSGSLIQPIDHRGLTHNNSNSSLAKQQQQRSAGSNQQSSHYQHSNHSHYMNGTSINDMGSALPPGVLEHKGEYVEIDESPQDSPNDRVRVIQPNNHNLNHMKHSNPSSNSNNNQRTVAFGESATVHEDEPDDSDLDDDSHLADDEAGDEVNNINNNNGNRTIQSNASNANRSRVVGPSVTTNSLPISSIQLTHTAGLSPYAQQQQLLAAQQHQQILIQQQQAQLQQLQAQQYQMQFQHHNQHNQSDHVVTEDSEGSYYSDEESSEDDSPRENRILTFADEHGKDMCAIFYYELDSEEDEEELIQTGGKNGLNQSQSNKGKSVQSGDQSSGCGKCAIQ